MRFTTFLAYLLVPQTDSSVEEACIKLGARYSLHKIPTTDADPSKSAEANCWTSLNKTPEKPTVKRCVSSPWIERALFVCPVSVVEEDVPTSLGAAPCDDHDGIRDQGTKVYSNSQVHRERTAFPRKTSAPESS